jgi:phage repressor protein C with HTH and peptisase S24 domain
MSENTEGKKTETPKKKLSWKEKLALLPEEEAKALRAKAAEASRISKARKRGTTPELSAVTRLEARLAKTDAQLAELKALRTELAAELKEAKKALAVAEKQAKTTVAEDNQEIGMAEAGDDERFPTEDEYNA